MVTIRRRESKTRRAGLEIVDIVKDYRAQLIGGMRRGLVLWCQACALELREDQKHLARCEGYSDIRAGKDLTVESELVEFIKSVMARRKQMNWD